LGLANIPREENVSVAVHHVSYGNHTIHRQWKLKSAIKSCEFDGEDLQGFRGGTEAAAWHASRRVVCELHGTETRCTQEERVFEIRIHEAELDKQEIKGI
jgi:hypothetical protein